MNRFQPLSQLPKLSTVGFKFFLMGTFLVGSAALENVSPSAFGQEDSVPSATLNAAGLGAVDLSAEEKKVPVQAVTTDPTVSEEARLEREKQEREEKQRREVAVALNYCRASFHRIRKYPTQSVMEEEQQKILNNLNLNGIQNEEIIKLYAEVLDEIGQIQLTEKEADLFENKYKRSIRQELAFDTLSIGLDLMTAQYIGAVRTGANSWWDYRNFKWNRDNEMLKLEKNRAGAVVKKSTSFLDTFWKLTRSHNIPDRWLVRSSDLDDLENAMNETNPEVRLRILKRMEPYMECYPPYWYYVARTQQSVGDLVASLDTYQRLSSMADGHFRRDDMMTSALANQAVIQAHLGHPAAVQTAQNALRYSTGVWEANLACARILQQAGRMADAEDAILRNLDVGLENEQSTVSLLTFYYDTNNTRKLAQYLGDEKMLARIPPPVLIRFASRLSEQETPDLVWTALASSMRLEPQMNVGPDSVLLTCHPVWRISRSKIGLHVDGGRIVQGELTRIGDTEVIRFANVGEFGGVLSGPAKLPSLKLEIQYGDKEPIQLAFSDQEDSLEATASTVQTATRPQYRSPNEPRSYHLISAQWGQRHVAHVTKSRQTAQAQPLPKSSSTTATQTTKAIKTVANIGEHAGGSEIKSAAQEHPGVKNAADTLIR